MKIGIITLPLNANYGGILQAYALQSFLKQMGHEVWTVDRNSQTMPLKIKMLSWSRRLILRSMGKKNVVIRTWATPKEQAIIRQHTDRFIRENIRLTRLFRCEADLRRLNNSNFNAFIVGSDQVWRPKYAPALKNHFLGFLSPKDRKTRRIAYAASFGVHHWEYSPGQTRKCRRLARKFDALSVREESGVNLCSHHLKVEAVQTLDPTLLLTKEAYVRLVEKDQGTRHQETFLTYVLDRTPEKIEVIKKVTDELNLSPTSIMPESTFRKAGKKNLEKCIAPPVTHWIRGFIDAKFVVTDSFHGTVFSILFNKPFLAVGNKKRGLARFNSLLKMVGLEDRLVLSGGDQILKKVRNPIDYSQVNQILKEKKEESYLFLKAALCE